METVVIGHRNPDMDSICSAVAYAELKRHLGMENIRAARAGALNERITFVLEKFASPQPDFLPDVTPRVRDAMVAMPVSTGADNPVHEALELMSSRRLRALPVVDREGKFRGLLSENKLLVTLFPPLGTTDSSRAVEASLANIARTFGGESLTGPLSDEEQRYDLVVAAMRFETFVERLDHHTPANTVLFIGDRENVQRAALQCGVRAIVVTGNTEVSAEVVAEAKRGGTSIIRSQWDTATTVFHARSAVVAGRVLEEGDLVFDGDLTLSQARKQAVLSPQFIYPVLDEAGCLEGVLSKSDFLKPPARQLILVDHNELSQAVPGASELPIVEILDHHRLGNSHTDKPILFINQPVGSTCTLVADLFQRHGLQPARPIAGLLMSGIIADTLNATSPTTTDLDRRLLAQLSEWAGILPADLATEIFSVGSPLLTLPPRDVIMADGKEYEERGVRFTVSQIEEITFTHFEERREQLIEALAAHVAAKGLYFAALLVTDVNKQNSYLLVAGAPEFINTITYPEAGPQTWFLEGIVSRKKQLLPYLAECLARAL
jgi:manganese-dependent inorganic pyrophosphatase